MCLSNANIQQPELNQRERKGEKNEMPAIIHWFDFIQ